MKLKEFDFLLIVANIVFWFLFLILAIYTIYFAFKGERQEMINSYVFALTAYLIILSIKKEKRKRARI
ncbi:hypothetical protein [Acinetobacter guillouiae]|uniref:hypothetical protein n=1 Tax=Acinetobacter guillouiae TaxID=106649 RepID=UPI001AE80E5F|nr:hypothetical protein [Acinetobacter guillouiae]MBP2546258.1 putative membrane protein [Acinetobacter guillouiae]